MESYIEYIGEYYGSNIYIKRDDKLPFSYGGNKVRIAAELFKDIAAGGYTAVISYGSAGSNMNRAVADTAKAHGIKCYVIIKKETGEAALKETENERLVREAGAEAIYCTDGRVRECVEEVLNKAKSDGFKPYYIYGDSTGQGNELALMRASHDEYAEIREYERTSNISFDVIVLTVGTGMTAAGFATAVNEELEEPQRTRLIGISAARTADVTSSYIRNALLKYFGGDESSIKVQPEIIDSYLCGGYGRYNAEIESAIRDMEAKDIALDPTYTGKCWYGLLKELEAGRISGNILFIHTGGYPDYIDWKKNDEKRLCTHI